MRILSKLLDDKEYDNEFSRKLIDSEPIFFDLLKSVCDNSWSNPPCYKNGSYLIDGFKYSYDLTYYPKQQLLYNVAKDINSVLEIGVYMGHSLLIMLLANPNLNITCIDITKELSGGCVEILKKYFPNSNINFIPGNSNDVLPTLNEKFDFFHIDSSHSSDAAKKEFNYCKKLCNNNVMKVIFDDIGLVGGVKDEIKNNFKVIKEIEPKCPLNNTPWYTNYYIEFELK